MDEIAAVFPTQGPFCHIVPVARDILSALDSFAKAVFAFAMAEGHAPVGVAEDVEEDVVLLVEDEDDDDLVVVVVGEVVLEELEVLVVVVVVVVFVVVVVVVVVEEPAKH